MSIFDAWNAATPKPSTNSLLAASVNAEKVRIARIVRAQSAVDGPGLGKPLKVGKADDNVVVNKLRSIVDTHVAFLFSEPPAWDLPAPENTPSELPADGAGTAGQGNTPQRRSEMEKWLEDCLRYNDWPVFLHDLAENGMASGTAYVRTDPVDPEDPDGGFPRAMVLDPACMSITADPRDITEVTSYWWTYKAYDPALKKEMAYRQRIDLIEEPGQPDRWRITEEHAPAETDPYLIERWVIDKQYDWLMPWSPVAHCKNLPCANKVYGRPTITDELINNNKQYNFNLSNRNKINRYQGHPIGWVRNVGGRTIKVDPDTFTDLGDGELGFLTPPTSPLPRELCQDLEGEILQQSATPAILLAGGKSDLRNPSGVALRTETYPLIARTTTMQALYGPLIVEVIRRLLELGGYGPDNIVVLTWAEPILLSVDPLQEMQTLQMELDAGITSRATVAHLRGRNYDEEQANINRERKASQANTPPAPGIATQTTVGMPPGMMQGTAQQQQQPPQAQQAQGAK